MKQNERNVSPMSNENRNAYVVEHITEATVSLLKEKELSDISISEICEKAGVGRVSFYRNYKTKEDILQNRIDAMLHYWDEDYKKTAKGSNAELYGSLFGHLKDNAEFYLLLVQRNLFHLFMNAFISLSGAKPEDDNMWAYTKSFIAYGTYGWIEEWIARGMQESAETMTVMLAAHGMK